MLNKIFSWIWVTHPRLKKPDAMLTFSAIALLACTLKVILNGVTLTVDGYTINFGTIDATVIAAMLGPTLAAYYGRKRDEPPIAPKEEPNA